jgi:hypothetical protein
MAVVAGLAGVLTFATAASAKKTTTTTTTSSTTTSTTAAGGTTTTTVPCNPAPTSSGGSPSLTANPGTCLNGGTPIAVTGSGYDPNSIGILLQCNNDPSQPSVALPAPVSQTVPVSCTGIAIANAIPTKTGSFSATWNTIAGTTGPPCGKAGDLAATCPADTSGGDAATDAAAYPCPPTPAQLAAGVSCTLAFGDEAGKTATVPISFVPAPTPTPPGGGGAVTTTTAAGAATAASTSGGSTTATTAAPKTAASSLAFTGPGTGLYIVGAAGFLMVLLGAAVLGLSGAPSSLMLALRRRRRNN